VVAKELGKAVINLLAKLITMTGCTHEKSGQYQVISLCLLTKFAEIKKGANRNQKLKKEPTRNTNEK